ncbi:hypothetical protein GX50_07412 [[Emmonsia] crescens]|uniref:Uncharacterized protein n=1 Tax=[Emmonsia] crescens TaxID=73230 RepID=A0A2B7Z9G1_9EURO|nr:hypothetical protein GX50_07412 [Emmonsia crescens]
MYHGIRNSVNSSRSGSGRGRRSHSEPAPRFSGTTFRRAHTDPTRPPPSYTTIFGPAEAGDAIPLHEFPTVEPCSRPLETIPEAPSSSEASPSRIPRGRTERCESGRGGRAKNAGRRQKRREIVIYAVRRNSSDPHPGRAHRARGRDDQPYGFICCCIL